MCEEPEQLRSRNVICKKPHQLTLRALAKSRLHDHFFMSHCRSRIPYGCFNILFSETRISIEEIFLTRAFAEFP